jgi:fructan beta-fructosidase
MTRRPTWPAGLLLCLLAPLPAPAADREDVLLADFEGPDYGDWKVTGEAFGNGPARGTLPNQMPVTGFLGKGLANSYHGGDRATGTLTSPPFTVQRRYINFLVGGGKYPGQTCVNLLVDGKVVGTATGPNDRPGGSERLDWHTWDVADLAGKTAVIEIVDRHTGGWGHITVDHIVQGDRRRQAEPAHRDLVIAGRYLNLPVKTGAPRRRLRYVVDGRTVREFEIELPDGEPDFWAFDEVAEWKGKRLRLDVDALPADSRALDLVAQGDEIKGAGDLYREKDRPQFHFTSRRGWLNDPNGLVYDKEEYHLFYQHNPYGWDWGNMHWGHAVSKDLVHWHELPVALYPRQFGDWCFSGSAVVDRDNTSGLKEGEEDLLVAAYTSTGRGECMAFSNDRGRTWSEYDGNPAVKHTGRDPRLLWHGPTKQWVMAVYDEADGKRSIAFHTSPDLKEWRFRSRVEDFFECPDLFELPVDGDAGKTKWVLYAGDAKYVLGAFDGRSFTAESGKQQLWYGNFYAAQTFSNMPDGRRVQIGWGNGITFPGMPFNQQMTFPCRLTLRTTADGVRLFAEPVREIESLHGPKHAWSDRRLQAGESFPTGVNGELFDVSAEFEPDGAEAFGLTVRGVPVTYDVKKQEFSCGQKTAPLRPVDGRVRLRLLVDRGSIEVFGNDGRVALSVGVHPAERERSLTAFTRGGGTRLRSLEVFELKSAWADD